MGQFDKGFRFMLKTVSDTGFVLLLISAAPALVRLMLSGFVFHRVGTVGLCFAEFAFFLEQSFLTETTRAQ